MQLPENYKIGTTFNEGSLYDINLKYYLKKFRKNSWFALLFSLIAKFLIKYQVFLSVETGRSDIPHLSKIYRDAEYSFILTAKIKILGKKSILAISSLAFDIPEKTNKSILIKQIQGVRGRRIFLRSFRLEKMLIEIATDWARKNSFSKVMIQSAKKNCWYNSSNEKRKKRLHLKYDVTAKRCGFKYNKTDEVFEKSLT